MEPTIHVISTGRQTIETFSEIMSTIHEYVDFIHIREKSRTAIEVAKIVERLKDRGVPLSKIIINDRVDVAEVTDVYGVQLAHHSLSVSQVKEHFPNLRIGKSVHSIDEALIAEKQGADHLLFGHLFHTASKPDLFPKGVSQLKQVTEQVSIPVIAIGGITPILAQDVILAGASGIAVMSGILQADDPLAAVKEYRNRIEEVQYEAEL